MAIKAFPNQGDNTPSHENYDGMDLRDYFAAKAMQGDMSASEMSLSVTDDQLQKLSELYYRVADAMLKERSNQGGEG